MLELPSDLRFFDKSLDDFRFVLVVVKQNLDGQIPTQVRVTPLDDIPALCASAPSEAAARAMQTDVSDGRPAMGMPTASHDGRKSYSRKPGTCRRRERGCLAGRESDPFCQASRTQPRYRGRTPVALRFGGS